MIKTQLASAMLAETIDSNHVIHSLMVVLIVGLCALFIWWVGNYFIKKFNAPPVASTMWEGLFIILGLFVAINFLLGLIGHQLVAW